MTNKIPIPERDIKKQCADYLKAMGWFTFHIMQGALSYVGISDLIAVKDGVTLFVEIKTDRGRLSDGQKKFQHDIGAAGGHYLVARCWQDVSEYIKREVA